MARPTFLTMLKQIDLALWSIIVLLLVAFAALASADGSPAAANILGGAAAVAVVKVWMSLSD